MPVGPDYSMPPITLVQEAADVFVAALGPVYGNDDLTLRVVVMLAVMSWATVLQRQDLFH